jgi:DNA-binding response OmpR family regulator
MSLGSKIPNQGTVAQRQAPELAKRILVVEDDPSVHKILKRLFEAEGFTVDGHMDGRAGLNSFHADPPHAAILDLHLPKLSGQHLCQEMKALAPSIPVIILTASSNLDDKITLLEVGADDYITKPFSPRELFARFRVALRHSSPPVRSSRLEFDGIAVDLEKVEVVRNGNPVALSAHEFKTLEFFLLNSDRLITRAELLNAVCGYENGFTSTRSIDNHILRLRQKLERDPSDPAHFRTVHGLGYRFFL